MLCGALTKRRKIFTGCRTNGIINLALRPGSRIVSWQAKVLWACWKTQSSHSWPTASKRMTRTSPTSLVVTSSRSTKACAQKSCMASPTSWASEEPKHGLRFRTPFFGMVTSSPTSMKFLQRNVRKVKPCRTRSFSWSELLKCLTTLLAVLNRQKSRF